MEVRTATEADIKKLAHMGCESFPTGNSYEERLKLYRTHPRRRLEDDILIAEVEGEMVAALSAIPFQVWIGGARLPMLGIAGVTNALEARRRGYASSLCIAAIKRGREQGFPVSILYPFRYNFYRKLGWGAVGEVVEYNFHPANLPRYPAREMVRRFHSDDMSQLAACYQRFVERGSCLAERPMLVWQEWLADLHERKLMVMVYEQNNRIEGYLTFEFEPGHELLSQVLVVTELVYDHHLAYQGLLGFLGTLSDQIATIRYWARPDEGFHHILNDPRDNRQAMLAGLVSRTGQYGISYMLRVLDVEMALKARSNYHNMNGAVSLQITDEQLPEQHRIFNFTLEDGRAKISDDREAKFDEIELSIDLFSQIYAGGISAERAYYLGLISAANAEAVDWFSKAMQVGKPFLLDQF